MVITPVAANGKIDLYNGAPGTAHLIADVFGYYLPGTAINPGALHPLTPTRILDTRTGTGATTPVPGSGQITLAVAGHGGVPTTGATAVILNVTATEPTTNGHITVWGDGATPNASSLNFVTGQTVPNLVIAPIATDGTVHFRNGARRHRPTHRRRLRLLPHRHPRLCREPSSPSRPPGSSTPAHRAPRRRGRLRHRHPRRYRCCRGAGIRGIGGRPERHRDRTDQLAAAIAAYVDMIRAQPKCWK